ncbi:MAG: RDD family protein [Desulfomonile tiedjei]|nr:RDD family protein [Desulfomonile tiedjei]
MAEKSYNVILEGATIPERSRQDVVKKLSAAFSKDTAFVEKLLSGKPKLIRQKVDHATAEKYRKIIEKAGAVCRIEPVKEAEPSPAARPAEVARELAPAAALATCPRCGYEATKDTDVMLVRGDCPRCGFMAKKEVAEDLLHDAGVEEEEFADTGEFSRDLFAERSPASMGRRALASIYTFSQFLTVYCILVLLFIVSFVPLNSVPEHVAKNFLFYAYTGYPMFLGVLSVLAVSFVAPLFNDGRSWGQKTFAIEVLYTAEAQFGGLLLSLTFRTLAICLLTFGPGLLMRWLGNPAFASNTPWAGPLVMISLGAIAWAVSWLLFLIAGGKRSLLDVAGGTVQIETGLMPPKALRKALLPLFTVLGILIVLAALPVALERLRW